MKRQKAKSKKQKAKVRLPSSLFMSRSFLMSLLSPVLFFPLVLWAQEHPSRASLEEGTLLVFHPIIVHFAIALVLFGFVVDCFGSVYEQMRTQEVGRTCFLAGVAALGAAVISGWVEQELPRPASVFDEQMQSVLFRHEYLGYGLLALFLVLTVMRLHIHGRLPAAFLFLAALGSAGIVLQGYWGGELVYRYGAGVRAVQLLSAPSLNGGQKKAPE